MRPILILAALSAALATPAAAGERAKTPAFYFGADLSYVNEVEDCGATFQVKGKPAEPYAIFRDTGHNLARIRLWNGATWTRYSDLADVKKSIRRAKAAGMQVLLDFHYSDDWADGDKQPMAKVWAGIADTDQLAEALYRYTRDTLVELDREGLAPGLVQVGNETNPEVLGGTKDKPIDWARNAKLLNAGIRAVRDFGKTGSVDPKVMLHIAQPENVEPWFKAAAEAGVTDFDQIGVSYYRKWSSQGLDGLAQTLSRLQYRYPGVEVILVETAYPWTQEFADELPNLLGPDTLLEGYPATPEGQLKYMVDLTQLVKSAGGVGVVYWEPAWVTSTCKTRWGQGSSWENATFFDFKRGNDLLPAAGYTAHKYAEPVEVTFAIRSSAEQPVLWGDFLGSRDFVVRLKPEGKGRWSFRTRLPEGQQVRYQVYASAALGQGLVTGDGVVDGFAAGRVGKRPTVFEHTAR